MRCSKAFYVTILVSFDALASINGCSVQSNRSSSLRAPTSHQSISH